MRTLQRRLVRVAAAAVAVPGLSVWRRAALWVRTGARRRFGPPRLGTAWPWTARLNVLLLVATISALPATPAAAALIRCLDLRCDGDYFFRSSTFGLDARFTIQGNIITTWEFVDPALSVSAFTLDAPTPVTEEGAQIPGEVGLIDASIVVEDELSEGKGGVLSFPPPEEPGGEFVDTRSFRFFDPFDPFGVTITGTYTALRVSTVTAVPLPGALILFGSGLACLAVLRRRNRSVRPA